MKVVVLGLGYVGTVCAACLARDGIEVIGVDVNEQNPEAVAFYRRLGFEVEGRSALDSAGRPFPLLHMRKCNVAER